MIRGSIIRRIQVLNFRSLQHVDLELQHGCQLLVGPAASGKTSLLDAILFVSDLFALGLDEAVAKRVPQFRDLVWERPHGGGIFEVALEIEIPELLREQAHLDEKFLRYELKVWQFRDGGIQHSERYIALEECGHTPRPLEWHFPVEEREVPETILLDPASNGSGVKVLDEAEVAASPAADWVRLLLGSGVRWIKFDGEKLRQPSPPADKDKDLLPDGSNLPWVILRMHKKDQEACIDWRLCAMSSFRRLRHIEALERESDGHAYLQLHYERGLVVPSWIASESMLRIIALAAVPFLVSAEPACILTSPRIYLFENPENGINRAEIEQIYKHLRWSYNAHVLIESNEIQMLYNVDDLQEIVGFCKNEKGIADVLTGDRHPHLQRWRGVVTALDKLFGQDSTG